MYTHINGANLQFTRVIKETTVNIETEVLLHSFNRKSWIDISIKNFLNELQNQEEQKLVQEQDKYRIH